MYEFYLISDGTDPTKELNLIIGFSTFGRIHSIAEPLPLIYCDEFKWDCLDAIQPLFNIKSNGVSFTSVKIPAG